MLRTKGFKVSEETKAKTNITRAKNKQAITLCKPVGLPILILSGKEKDGYDFRKLIRRTMRKLKLYNAYSSIEKEISTEKVYYDVKLIKEILKKYFHLKRRRL